MGFQPRARATATPACVRSRMIPRSNRAELENTLNVTPPDAMEVSMELSESEWQEKCTNIF